MAPLRWDQPAKLGLVAAGTAAVVLALSVRSALRAVDTPLGASAPARVSAVLPSIASFDVDTSLLRDAVAHDPFRPDRSRAAARYVPPEERRPSAPAPRARQRDPLAGLRLVGTAAEGGGGAIAIIAGLGRTPRVLRIGDLALAGWRLAGVEGDAATLTHLDSAVVVRVTRSGVTRSRP